MKKIFLSILCSMLVFFGLHAEEYTYTFDAKQFSANGTKTLNGVDWTLAGNGGYWGYDGTKGQQLGSGSKPYKSLTLSTSGIEGTITKIVVNTSGASSVNAKLAVSVGGTQFGDAISLTTTATGYTFQGSASGEILFSYTQTSSKAIYIKSITVTYTPDGGAGGETPEPVDVVEPTFSPADGTIFEENLTVTINADDDIYYSTDGENYSKYNAAIVITETTTVKAYAQDAEGNRSDIVEAKYTKNALVDPEATSATLSFADKAQRASYSTSQQVWAQNGITFTNDKGSSTSNVGDYANPARCYKGSSITIEVARAISKIEFDCSSEDYATALANSIGNAASASGDKVTVNITPASTTFTIASLTAQVRLDALTVTFSTGEEQAKPAAPTFSVAGGSKFYPTMSLEISAVEGAIYYTIDGNEPTVESIPYSSAITLDETTTVKAIAVVDGVASDVATAIYKKVAPSVEGSVADALECYVDGEEIPAVITGYIVGYVGGTNLGTDGANCVFSASGEIVTSNILIADDADETDYTKCLVVQLPDNGVRGALNLQDCPNNLKKRVVLNATLMKYFGVAGLKNTKVNGTGMYYNVSVAGYSTLYLGHKTLIPSTVEAYIVTDAKESYVSLTQVEGVVPDSTGLVLKGEGEHLFYLTSSNATADFSNNMLTGSVKETMVEEEAYVLGIIDGSVGFYKAKMSDGKFLNNANKAYLPLSALPVAAQNSASLRFDDGTTNIEYVNSQSDVSVIFDLAGHRIERIVSPGIYIIGGKKVLVK